MDRFNEEVGERLRQARRARGWSLIDVEETTSGEFKASVLGAYERGERSVSAARLWRLAQVYGVHVATLLPGVSRENEDEIDVMIDLDAAEDMSGEQAELFDRYLSAIQIMRKDATGPTLAVRRSDLKVLTALLDTKDPQAALERLSGHDR